MNVSVSGTIDQKTYLKKIKRASAPLAPPGSAPLGYGSGAKAWPRCPRHAYRKCAVRSSACWGRLGNFSGLLYSWSLLR